MRSVSSANAPSAAARATLGSQMRGQNLKFFLGVLVFLGIVGAVLKTWYVDIVTVGHDGMAPTLFAGDTVLVWRGSEPEHGAIMLCHHPTDPTRFVIGRIVGRNGAAIRADRGRLQIEETYPPIDWHGTVQYADPVSHQPVAMRWGYEALGNDNHLVFQRDGREMQLRPVGYYDGFYLLDDNRTYPREDSREFGAVPEGRCVGRVFMRVAMSPSTPPEIENQRFQLLR